MIKYSEGILFSSCPFNATTVTCIPCCFFKTMLCCCQLTTEKDDVAPVLCGGTILNTNFFSLIVLKPFGHIIVLHFLAINNATFFNNLLTSTSQMTCCGHLAGLQAQQAAARCCQLFGRSEFERHKFLFLSSFCCIHLLIHTTQNSGSNAIPFTTRNVWLFDIV